MARLAFAAIALTCVTTAFAAQEFSITADPYLTGGLFTNPLLPFEEQEVTITVRAASTGGSVTNPEARLTILDKTGEVLVEQILTLQRQGETAEATYTWSSDHNGLFTVRAEVDPANKIPEENEEDNVAELTLPVIVKGKGRALHFAWYKEVPGTRWATCITSTGKDKHARLAERGVLPLKWAYGGMSWSYYDKKKALTHPEEVLADIEQLFYEKYSTDADVYGFGIDECGGYPGTWSLDASIASMKGLIRARKETRNRVFAVWNGGGLRPELGALYRRAADLLLLETYCWRALPDALGAVDIYQMIVDRIEPFVRSTDMFQPAYGNHCYTLIALDNTERPDRTDLGELENVIRFIRRRFPEMRGIAWYTGSTYMEKTEANLRKMEEVKAASDRLCFEYWVKPCVTFLRESLWLTTLPDGTTYLAAAVNNIGSVDSGKVTVEFLVDGQPVGAQSANHVPAGPGRYESLVLLKQPVTVQRGPHEFKARIVSVQEATVLDSTVTLERYVD